MNKNIINPNPNQLKETIKESIVVFTSSISAILITKKFGIGNNISIHKSIPAFIGKPDF